MTLLHWTRSLCMAARYYWCVSVVWNVSFGVECFTCVKTVKWCNINQYKQKCINFIIIIAVAFIFKYNVNGVSVSMCLKLQTLLYTCFQKNMQLNLAYWEHFRQRLLVQFGRYKMLWFEVSQWNFTNCSLSAFQKPQYSCRVPWITRNNILNVIPTTIACVLDLGQAYMPESHSVCQYLTNSLSPIACAMYLTNCLNP